MDLTEKARAAQNALEKIASSIPFYKGYRDKELRRDADRLEREHLADRLEECKKALNQMAAAASRTGGLDSINDIETARKRLDKVANRIRYADRGYSGFFDAVKIQEDTLAQVYDFDLSLVRGVEDVKAAATRSEVSAMIQALDALDSRLAEREEILSGIR